MGSNCNSNFANYMTNLFMTARYTGGWASATKPDVNVADARNPLAKDWRYPSYNFSNAAASRLCVVPTDPLAWVALSAGAGESVRQLPCQSQTGALR